MKLRAHPLQQLHRVIKYVWWTPILFGCLPNWIPYLILCYCMARLRKAGFSEPYKTRFNWFFFLSLFAFGFYVRESLIEIETAAQRIFYVIVMGVLSVTRYKFVDTVCEIFAREQVIPVIWKGIRTTAKIVVATEGLFLLYALFHVGAPSSAGPIAMIMGVGVIAYILGWIALLWQLHTATKASEYLVEDRVAVGTIISPTEEISNDQTTEVARPFNIQFSLATMFVLMLVAALSVELWNQPLPIKSRGSNSSSDANGNYRLHYAGAGSDAYIAIIERSKEPIEDTNSVQFGRSFVQLHGVKINARRNAQLYYYDRDEEKWERLKSTNAAMRDAMNVDSGTFWITHVKPQLE